jgi:hypothetical protein
MLVTAPIISILIVTAVNRFEVSLIVVPFLFIIKTVTSIVYDDNQHMPSFNISILYVSEAFQSLESGIWVRIGSNYDIILNAIMSSVFFFKLPFFF